MKEKTTIQRNIEIGVLIGLICAVILSFAGFDSACDNIRQNVLRLHILANSNSQADQEIKLKIRDEILKNTNIFEECTDLDSAVLVAEQEKVLIENTAKRVLEQNGFNYDVSVEIGDSNFTTREYDDFTLPAGTYKSVIVKLGKAEGKNFWCVLFPAVCVPSATKHSLDESVSKSASEIAENPEGYVMRFKAIEWYESIKNKLKK